MKSFFGEKLGIPSEKRFANRIYNIIFEHHSEQGVIPSVQEISSRMNYSKRTFQRMIAVEETTFDEIIHIYRKDLYAKLIMMDIPIKQMSAQLGFKHHTSLYSFSVRNWGLSPTGVRRTITKNSQGLNV